MIVNDVELRVLGIVSAVKLDLLTVVYCSVYSCEWV